MRSGLERQFGFRVHVRHPLISLLVRHAANTFSWTAKGHDGVTAYQRVRRKPFRTRLMTFGEQCRLKLRSHEPMSSSGDGRTFHVGTYVGVDRLTGQQMIHRGDSIEYARTVLRFPESNKCDKDGDVVAECWHAWSAKLRRKGNAVS